MAYSPLPTLPITAVQAQGAPHALQRADTNVNANGAETFPDVVARTLRAGVKTAGTGRSSGKKLPDKHVSNPIAAPFSALLTRRTIPALPKSGGTAGLRGSGRVTTAQQKGYTKTDPGAGAKKGADKPVMSIEAERLRTLEHVLLQLTSNVDSHHKPLSEKVSGVFRRGGHDVAAHQGPAGRVYGAPGGPGSPGTGPADAPMNERLQAMLLPGNDTTDKAKVHLPLVGAGDGGATGLRRVAANPGTAAQQSGQSGDYSQRNGTAPVPLAPASSGNSPHFAAIERSEIRLWRATGNGTALNLGRSAHKAYSRMPALGGVPAGGGLMANPMYTVSPAAQIMTALQPHGDMQQFGSMLGKQLMTMLSNGNQQAVLHLDPPQLGPLQVHLSTRQYNVSAWFISAHADVRQALEAGMPALRYALAQQGVALAGGFIADQGQRQSFGDRTAPNRFAAPFVALDEVGPGATLQEVSRTIPRWSAAGLSIYV